MEDVEASCMPEKERKGLWAIFAVVTVNMGSSQQSSYMERDLAEIVLNDLIKFLEQRRNKKIRKMENKKDALIHTQRNKLNVKSRK